MKHSQILVEVPANLPHCPVGPWWPKELPGFTNIPIEETEDYDDAEVVEEGDYVFTDGGEIDDISHALIVDVNGKEVSYDDSKSYAVYDRQGEFGDCVNEPACDFFSVLRRA